MRESVSKAQAWLERIRNKDHAWGDHEGWESHPSVSSEIVIGLMRTGVKPDSRLILQVLPYLELEADRRKDDTFKETRVICNLPTALYEAGRPLTHRLQRQYIELIWRYRNPGGGWPLRKGEKVENIYDTACALRTLKRVDKENKSIIEAATWLEGCQNHDGGWPLHTNQNSDIAATAVSITALSETGASDGSIKSGIEFLKNKRNSSGGWDSAWEDDPIHGHGKWFHFTTAYCCEALVKAKIPLNSVVLVRAFRCMLKNQHPAGGWKPLAQYDPFTWATAYALWALGSYMARTVEVRLEKPPSIHKRAIAK